MCVHACAVARAATVLVRRGLVSLSALRRKKETPLTIITLFELAGQGGFLTLSFPFHCNCNAKPNEACACRCLQYIEMDLLSTSPGEEIGRLLVNMPDCCCLQDGEVRRAFHRALEKQGFKIKTGTKVGLTACSGSAGGAGGCTASQHAVIQLVQVDAQLHSMRWFSWCRWMHSLSLVGTHPWHIQVGFGH